MATRINHTGRKKLDRSAYDVTLTNDTNGIPSFGLKISAGDLNFPDDTRVIVEAYSSNLKQRYDFGTLGLFQAPSDTSLDYISASAKPLFNILLIDDRKNEGRLVGYAKSVEAKSGSEDDGGSSLLVVTTYDIGERIWNIQMNPGNRPQLCLNQKIPDVIQKLKTQADFQSMILPAAFKEVMTSYYITGNRDDDDNIQNQWWGIAEGLAGELESDASTDRYFEWIDYAVAQFCRQHQFCANLLENLEEPQH